jgi:hypothetical protein
VIVRVPVSVPVPVRVGYVDELAVWLIEEDSEELVDALTDLERVDELAGDTLLERLRLNERLGLTAADFDVEGELAGDVEGVTDWTMDCVEVPDAGIVATSNPIDAGGTHNVSGATGSLHGRAYTPN